MIVNGETLSMTRGDSECLIVKIKDRPFDDGDVITMTVRKKVDTDILFQKEVTDFDEGSAIIEIDSEDTKELSFGKYMYDIQWEDPDGKIRTIIKPVKNNFVLTEEVTY